MLCVGLVLGFLVASVAFFTPLGRRRVTHVMCVQFIVRDFTSPLQYTAPPPLVRDLGPLLRVLELALIMCHFRESQYQ